MKPEELSILIQLVESIDLAVKQLDEAIKKTDAEKVKKIKQEIMVFQREMARVIE